jgi:hypothetical protein
MLKLSNAQEAFDTTMMAYSEILTEINPEVAKEFALWNVEVAQEQAPVTRFSSSYDPGKKFEVIAHFDGEPQKRFEANLG